MTFVLHRSKLAFLIAIIALCQCAFAQLAKSPWPKYRSNLTNTSLGSPGGLNGLVKWTATFGRNNESSAVIGADGTIYIGSGDDNLYAINPDGTQKWSFLTAGFISGSAAVASDGTIYIGSYDDYLYALNPDGTKKWSFQAAAPIAVSPSIGSDGTIYVCSLDGIVHALNPSGSQKWTYQLADAGAGIMCSPAIGTDGTIYVCCDDLYALNPGGTKKWMLSGSFEGDPAIGANGAIYMVTQDYALTAISSSGTVTWTTAIGGISGIQSPSIDASGTIYVATGHSLSAVSATGSIKWTTGEPFPVDQYMSPPTIGADGTIYIAAGFGFQVFNSSGTFEWYADSFACACQPTLAADGTLYVANGDVGLDAIGTAKFSVDPLAGLTASSPVFLAGQYPTLTLTLAEPAPAKLLATLTCSEPSLLVGLASSVGIDSGLTSTTSKGFYTAPVTVSTPVTITATEGGKSYSVTLIVEPQPTFVSLTTSPSSVIGGTPSVGTLTLNEPAPAGGFGINVFSSNANATVPATVTVPQGLKSTTFPIPTVGVAHNTTATITAWASNSTIQFGAHQAVVAIKAAAIQSFTVSPLSVIGSSTTAVTGLVILTGPAPAGGAVVIVASYDDGAASVPTKVTIPAGKTSASFPIQHFKVTTSTAVELIATYEGVTKSATLTVTP